MLHQANQKGAPDVISSLTVHDNSLPGSVFYKKKQPRIYPIGFDKIPPQIPKCKVSAFGALSKPNNNLAIF